MTPNDPIPPTIVRVSGHTARAETVTAPREWLVTYRVVIPETGRALTYGFHIEPRFTDDPDHCSSTAEFGDLEIAIKTIRHLRYPVVLGVKAVDWEGRSDEEVQRACVRLADTGASANMLFWSPGSRVARAHMGRKPAAIGR